MIMDILVLAVFALSIFFSLRKGFAAALAGFFKGIAAVAVAWFFCDDLAAALLKVPAVHTFAVEKISQLRYLQGSSRAFHFGGKQYFKCAHQ